MKYMLRLAIFQEIQDLFCYYVRRMEDYSLHKWKFPFARNAVKKYRGETGLTSVRSPPRRCVSTGKRKRRLGKSRVPLTT